VELVVPDVRVAPRSARSKVGHFVGDVGYDGLAHYLQAYRAAMAALPPFDAQTDVATSFGAVRVYRFDGQAGDTPVVLLPGRFASTSMWRANLPGLLKERTVYGVDLLGEAGLSVQDKRITDADDQAQWLDELLIGLGLARVHLFGASIGGWAAVNYAARKPGRAASLTLLDPVQTFGRIPFGTLLWSGALVSPGVPNALRARLLRRISGGAEVDESAPELASISAAMVDFVLRLPPPKFITDDQLRSVDVPVLALLGGRSVMLNAARAAARAQKCLPHGQAEVWEAASHAINGEFPERITERVQRFWAGC
jgi:pimeloyl-ACP methyl ester carboxylesterase